jgi:hypothetical protein
MSSPAAPGAVQHPTLPSLGACLIWQSPVVRKVSNAVVDAAAAALCGNAELHRGLTPEDSAAETFWHAWLARFSFHADPAGGTGALG